MCKVCNEAGHTANVCKKKKGQKTQAAQSAVEEEGEEHLFTVHLASEKQMTHTWLIDSGCSNHMTPNQDLFTVLNQECRSKVRVGNGEVLEAHGKGTISVDTHQGTKLISDVLYVSKLAVNLLSVP